MQTPITATELRTHAAKMADQLDLPAEIRETDTAVIDAAEAAVKGWKRLGNFADPIYVRNLDGQLWCIQDVRGYHDGEAGHRGWHLSPLVHWIDSMNADDWMTSWDRLGDAKAAAARMAS